MFDVIGNTYTLKKQVTLVRALAQLFLVENVSLNYRKIIYI